MILIGLVARERSAGAALRGRQHAENNRGCQEFLMDRNHVELLVNRRLSPLWPDAVAKMKPALFERLAYRWREYTYAEVDPVVADWVDDNLDAPSPRGIWRPVCAILNARYGWRLAGDVDEHGISEATYEMIDAAMLEPRMEGLTQPAACLAKMTKAERKQLWLSQNGYLKPRPEAAPAVADEAAA